MRNCSEFNEVPPKDDLELPDWSGSQHSRQPLSTDAAFQFCERYAAEWPEVVKRLRARRPEPCHVEFVL